LSDRFGTRPITLIGLGILTLGYLFLSTITSSTTTTGFVIRFLPIGIGMGIFQSPNNSAIMGIAPKDRLGTVSGMLAVNRTLGQTTGIAMLGAIWASRVFHYSGSSSLINATDAPVQAQVSGLQDSFYIIVIMLVSALGYSLLSLRNIPQLSHQARGAKTENTRTE